MLGFFGLLWVSECGYEWGSAALVGHGREGAVLGAWGCVVAGEASKCVGYLCGLRVLHLALVIRCKSAKSDVRENLVQ